MNIGDLRSSKYLKKEDVGDGITVTISGLSQQNVAQEGAEPDMKWVLHFHELEKPLVLNSTNGQLIAKITGYEEDIEKNWPGKVVELYNDPSVMFKGEIKGGIRVRAVSAKVAQPKQATPLTQEQGKALNAACAAAGVTAQQVRDWVLHQKACAVNGDVYQEIMDTLKNNPAMIRDDLPF